MVALVLALTVVTGGGSAAGSQLRVIDAQHNPLGEVLIHPRI